MTFSPLFPTLSDCLCMLWIVAVGVEAQAMAEGRFGAELFFRHAGDVGSETSMRILKVPSDLRQSQTSPLLRHNSIAAIDSAMGDGISRQLVAFENCGYVLERFLLPGCDMGKGVAYRPLACDTRFHHLRVG